MLLREGHPYSYIRHSEYDILSQITIRNTSDGQRFVTIVGVRWISHDIDQRSVYDRTVVDPLLVTSYFLMMKRGYQIFTGDYSSLFREGVKNNIVLDYPMSMAAMLLSHAAITFETQNEKLVPILLDIGWPGINMGIVRTYKFMGNCSKYVLMNLDQTIVRLEYIGEGFGSVDSTNDNYGELNLPHLLETGFP